MSWTDAPCQPAEGTEAPALAGAPALRHAAKASATISHAISAPLSSNPEAARPPLLTVEAAEQPNSKPVWGRGAENVTGGARRVLREERRGGFREGWIVGASGEVQSSWRVLISEGSLRPLERSRGTVGRSAEEKGQVFARQGAEDSARCLGLSESGVPLRKGKS